MVADPRPTICCLSTTTYCFTRCTIWLFPSSGVCVGRILPCLCPRHSRPQAKSSGFPKKGNKSLRTNSTKLQTPRMAEPRKDPTASRKRCALSMPPLRKSQALSTRTKGTLVPHPSSSSSSSAASPLCYPTKQADRADKEETDRG